jgi:threonyl-tRNA synthetase
MDLPNHRQLGRELGIFATEEACGAGLPLWLPAGATVREQLRAYVIELERRHGYRHVSTPDMARRSLYERSGHWAHYQEAMFPPMGEGADQLVLRPMLCPHHILIYDGEPRSVRELPYRLAEVGTMFRYERSGVVSGLSRVRQMTLTDGHVFCAPEQVAGEIVSILEMVHETYGALSIPPPRLRLSRAGAGAKYVRDPAAWQRSEGMIRDALARAGAEYVEAPDEAAFYGPKIDLQVTDPQGREETLSTIQVDVVLPGRFGLGFRRADDGREPPVIVHRSVASTLERMVAHLLEVHDGALPVWLSPVQVQVLPVGGSSAGAHAVAVRDALAAAGLRVEIDDRDHTLAARVREAWQRRIPYVAVAGDREAADGSISVRVRGTGPQPGPVPVAGFVAGVADVVARYARDPA